MLKLTYTLLGQLASCLLPFAFCLLPFAFCLLPFASCLLPFASCLTKPTNGLFQQALINCLTWAAVAGASKTPLR